MNEREPVTIAEAAQMTFERGVEVGGMKARAQAEREQLQELRRKVEAIRAQLRAEGVEGV